jgi:hypothetical protein
MCRTLCAAIEQAVECRDWAMLSTALDHKLATIGNVMSPQGHLNQQWFLDQLLKQGVEPELVTCIGSIRHILGYDIPQERESSLLRFQQFVSTGQLESLVPWRGHHRTTKQRWFFGCYAGITVHVRGALAAAHYHADRLREIQERVNAILAEPRVKQLFANSGFGIGYTRTLEHFLFYRRPSRASLNQAFALAGVMHGRASVMA